MTDAERLAIEEAVQTFWDSAQAGRQPLHVLLVDLIDRLEEIAEWPR